MNARRLIFVLLLCLLFVPVEVANIAYAADAPSQPTVYCSENIDVAKGNGFYVYVYAKDFVDVAGLDLYVYYDTDLFTLGSVSKETMLDGTLSDINAETAGTVCMSMVSAGGISGNSTLLRILFYAKSDAAEGKHCISVAAGDCYDKSLNTVSLATNNCYVNVTSASQIAQNVNFYSSCNASELKKGESFDITFYTYNSYGFATANFEIEYDSNLLQLNSAAFGHDLTNVNGAVYSVNDEVEGYISASYAALSDVPSRLSQAFVASFTVIGDVDADTVVNFKASGVYNSQLVAYNGNKCDTSIKLCKTPTTVETPKVYVRSISTAERNFTVQIVSEANSCIAAGDFYVSFDENLLNCEEIKSVADDCMVVGNPNYSAGQARFSFIYEAGITTETVIAELVFTTTATCGTLFDLELQSKNLSDSEYAVVSVDCVGGRVMLQHLFEDDFSVDIQPSCENEGSKSKHCLYCETNEGQTVIPVLGHDLVHHDGKAATCTEYGWRGYDTCSRCDYSTYSELAAKGHVLSNAVEENKVEATCTNDGHYDSVIYCTVCNEELSREHKTVVAVGHIPADWIVDQEATCTEAGSKHTECSVCHEHLTTEIIAAHGHQFGDWITVEEPTAKTKGRKIHSCRDCGYEEERSIDKLQDNTTIGIVFAVCGGVVVTASVVSAIVVIFIKRKRKLK